LVNQMNRQNEHRSKKEIGLIIRKQVLL
jgi:hypothetical protein